MRDLQKEKLALFILPKGPLSIAQVQGQLMGAAAFRILFLRFGGRNHCSGGIWLRYFGPPGSAASGYAADCKAPAERHRTGLFWNLLSGAPGQSGAESPDPMCQGVFCAAACVGSKKR